MSQVRTNGIDRLHRRRWSFANCIFDESNWSLSVAGRRVPVEIKPLALLRALLLQAGKVVPKDDLLDAVWPDVEVVEASLTTAVRKLRRALADERRKTPIIETAPRIGYRLAVPVVVEELDAAPEAPISAPPPTDAAESNSLRPALAPAGPSAPSAGHNRLPMLLTGIGGLAIGIAVATIAMGRVEQPGTPKAAVQYTQADAASALRKLDLAAIERMLAAGWDPSTPWDQEGNDALTMLLNRCEWDRGHDRRKMLLMARTLIEGGAKIDRRNVWGDTAYSIAKAPRYCGPDHPVTQMLEAMCYGGSMGPKDLCLATYELTPQQRRAQGLPPKG